MTEHDLSEALESVDFSKACVKDNRGYDKELAKEALRECIAFRLWPAIVKTLEELESELSDQEVIRLAKYVLKLREKHER